MSKNYTAISSLLDTINVQFSAIGLTEIWIKEANSFYNFNNFTFLFNERHGKKGGGVGILLNNKLKYKQRNDLDVNNECFESMFIEIEKVKKNVLIGVIYRPPNQSVQSFLDILEDILNIIYKEKKDIYLMGDFNINLFDINSCQSVNDFLDLLMIHFLYPMIHCPTRITDRSCTLIDNIFTNNLDESWSGTILSDISDHLPVFLINKKQCINNENNSYFKRDMNDDNINKFMQLIFNSDWSVFSEDPNYSYECFIRQYTRIFNQCFPLKEYVKSKKYNNPWYTKELRKLCKKKCKLCKKYLRKRTDYRKEKYNKYRNM